jgi:hypothetical protein
MGIGQCNTESRKAENQRTGILPFLERLALLLQVSIRDLSPHKKKIPEYGEAYRQIEILELLYV